MLTLDSFQNKVLVEYERDSKRVPKGIVVAIGPGILGWALCNKKDTFNKAQGLHIALNRALSVKFATDEERIAYYQKCPFTLQPLLEKIGNRSLIYYKPRDLEGGC